MSTAKCRGLKHAPKAMVGATLTGICAQGIKELTASAMPLPPQLQSASICNRGVCVQLRACVLMILVIYVIGLCAVTNPFPYRTREREMEILSGLVALNEC